MSIMKKIIAVLIIFLISTASAKAETICFKDVLDKAIKNSYDLKISQTDMKIAETEIKEARAEYLPVVSLNYDAVYNRDLTKGTATSSLSSIGSTTVMNSTSYQNAISAGLQYNLFDFGIRKKKLDIAKKDKSQKQTIYIQDLRDLKIGLADAYTKVLLTNRELSANEELLGLNKTLFSMYENIYNAGTIRKTDLTDQAVKVAILINKIDDLTTGIKNAFSDISFYTGESYTTSSKFLNLLEEEQGVIPVSNIGKSAIKLEINESDILNIEKFPEYKEYQLEIEKKKAELSVLKRQNLPQFKFYTNYYFYGSDKDNFSNTFKDMGSKSASFRISSSLPVFDGLKNQALRERAKLEIEKLSLERDKKVQTVKTYYEKIYDQSKDMPQKIINQSTSLKLTEEKINMLEKLNHQHLIDKISYLKQKVDLINQKFEFEKTKINSEAAAYKIRILAESEEEFIQQNNLNKKNTKPKLKTVPIKEKKTI